MACFVPGPAAGVRHEVIIGPVVDLDVTGGWCGKAWLSQVRELAILLSLCMNLLFRVLLEARNCA